MSRFRGTCPCERAHRQHEKHLVNAIMMLRSTPCVGTCQEYHEQIQGPAVLVQWHKDNHSNNQITVGEWQLLPSESDELYLVLQRCVEFWQPLKGPKFILKMAGE